MIDMSHEGQRPTLLQYRLLEQALLLAGLTGNREAGERIVDEMDRVWYALTPEDRAWLDARMPA